MNSTNELYLEDLNTAWKNIPGKEEICNKAFLVTGITGQIGAFIVDMLMYANSNYNAGIKIYASGRNEELCRKMYSDYLENSCFELVLWDVTEKLEFNKAADYVLHLAGDGYPEAFKNRPVETMTPALTGTLSLLNYAKDKDVKCLLYASSGEVYGMGNGGEKGYVETEAGYIDTMQPRSCYPMAKRAAETLCAAFCAEYGICTKVARLSHIYGPRLSEKDNRATTQFFNKALAGEDIVLYSAGRQMRSYTYVADAVSGLFTILIKGEAANAYNVANRDSRVTIAEFANIISERAGVEQVFRIANESEARELTPIEYAVLNSDKLESLGWTGKYDINTGIANCISINRN